MRGVVQDLHSQLDWASRELVGALPRCTFIFNGVYIFNLQPITLSYCPEGQTVCMSDVYIYI